MFYGECLPKVRGHGDGRISYTRVTDDSSQCFKLGSEKHTTEVVIKKSGEVQMITGLEGLAVLKTTKSGFKGFIRDKYSISPDTRERMWQMQFLSGFLIYHQCS